MTEESVCRCSTQGGIWGDCLTTWEKKLLNHSQDSELSFSLDCGVRESPGHPLFSGEHVASATVWGLLPPLGYPSPAVIDGWRATLCHFVESRGLSTISSLVSAGVLGFLIKCGNAPHVSRAKRNVVFVYITCRKYPPLVCFWSRKMSTPTVWNLLNNTWMIN